MPDATDQCPSVAGHYINEGCAFPSVAEHYISGGCASPQRMFIAILKRENVTSAS